MKNSAVDGVSKIDSIENNEKILLRSDLLARYIYKIDTMKKSYQEMFLKDLNIP